MGIFSAVPRHWPPGPPRSSGGTERRVPAACRVAGRPDGASPPFNRCCEHFRCRPAKGSGRTGAAGALSPRRAVSGVGLREERLEDARATPESASLVQRLWLQPARKLPAAHRARGA